MKDAQKPDHISLIALVGHLKEGRFVIPNFQRDFEWEPWDISALMRSIFLDYYIGSLLLWRGKSENFTALACEPIYAYKGNKKSWEHIVIDGQQRLTAMYYAFMAPMEPAPGRKSRFLFFIRVDKFMAEAYDDAFTYDWKQYGEKLLKDINSQYESHWFPLSVIGEGGWALPNWVQGYEKYWLEKAEARRMAGNGSEVENALKNAENARRFGEYLKALTEQYQIAYIELDRDLELDKVCDIFTQINSRGIRLDVFDLMNALLVPKALQLRKMWDEAKPRLSFVETDRMNVYVLQVMSILRQAYCSPKYLYYLLPGQERQIRELDGSLRKEVLIPSAKEFEKRWMQAITHLENSIKLLKHPQEYGAIASQYLPYVSILPAFAALQASVKDRPANKRLDAQRKVRQWYWASVFTKRYSGAVESTTTRDFQDVSSWFDDDILEPALISDFRERFRTIDLRQETRRGGSVYNGIFNLLVVGGAKDWISGTITQVEDLDDHHIVPKSWANDVKLEVSIDTIINRTPLTRETNQNIIRDRLPNRYLPELIAANDEVTVRGILESHLISPVAFDILLRDPFTPEHFNEFLSERQRTIQDAIEDLLVKARLDLPPRLRELDAQIEEVELGLRVAVATALEDKPANMPNHVRANITERLEKAARKNPALNLNEYSSLNRLLEFADMRELQDIIVSKPLWSRFEKRFLTKEVVSGRFDQIAELRNNIRHSRKTTGIVQKDGEAAILWFKGVLAI